MKNKYVFCVVLVHIIICALLLQEIEGNWIYTAPYEVYLQHGGSYTEI